MKRVPTTKTDNRNTKMPKKNHIDVISANCDVIFIYPICSNPDAWSVKVAFSLKVTFYLTKT